MRIIAFWEEKSFFEKSFWCLFFVGVILFLFYHYRFEAFLSQEHNIQPYQEKPMKKAKSFEILQEIIQNAKHINIKTLNSNNNHISIQASGDFDALMQWFYFIESFAQNFILDFKISSNNGLNLEITFEIKE